MKLSKNLTLHKIEKELIVCRKRINTYTEYIIFIKNICYLLYIVQLKKCCKANFEQDGNIFGRQRSVRVGWNLMGFKIDSIDNASIFNVD